MTTDELIETILAFVWFIGMPVAYGFLVMTIGMGPFGWLISIPLAFYWPVAALVWFGASFA